MRGSRGTATVTADDSLAGGGKCDAVLFWKPRVVVREHAEYGNASSFFEGLDTRGQEGPVPAELGDHHAGHSVADVGRQELERPHDRRENASTLDVCDQQHVDVRPVRRLVSRPAERPRRLDVRQVPVVEVDLGYRPGPFGDH
jgi:hypothetical protein